ncbi:MAG: thermonuclease family protein [Halorhabdus sp.]
MRGHVVTVGIVIMLAGCALPGGQIDATTAPSPNVDSPWTEVSDGTRACSAGDSWTVTVVDVVDADTMDVRYRNGSRETIRLLGVDAPEPRAAVTPEEWDGIPDTDAGRTWLREWGENASRFAEERLAGKRIRIVTDPMAGRRGGYGRVLVYVLIDGTVFGEQLLKSGYARRYETTFELSDRFAAAENRAQTAERGVWGFET